MKREPPSVRFLGLVKSSLSTNSGGTICISMLCCLNNIYSDYMRSPHLLKSEEQINIKLLGGVFPLTHLIYMDNYLFIINRWYLKMINKPKSTFQSCNMWGE